MSNRLGQGFVELLACFHKLAHAATGARKPSKARIDEAGLPDLKLRRLLFLG